MSFVTRARVAGIVPLCLLLLSSLSATGALASAPPPASQGYDIVVGKHSCLGDQACVLAVGPIGDNSCNGYAACQRTQGSIGDNSCNADRFACIYSPGSVGDNSCNEVLACEFTSGNVGNGSCNARSACYYSTDIIGNYSCNGTAICSSLRDNIAIGDCQRNDIKPAICLAQPDARIRIAGGELWGNDIYNGDGLDQSVSTAEAGDKYLRFYISIQNDAPSVAATYTVDAEGAATAGFGLRYFSGNSNHEITAAVEAGTFITPVLAAGKKFQILVRVYIGSEAAIDSNLSRLITASNEFNSAKLDTVGFSVRRR